MSNKYRSIYVKHFGPIPVDEDGRTYEIHHIDGNHNNNDPNNLIALSIRDHYQIHLDQGDYASCIKILSRMQADKETISEIARKYNAKSIDAGTHPWLGGERQRALQKRRVADGTHHWLGQNNPVYRLLKEGTHPFMGEVGSNRVKSIQRRMVEDGTHHLLSGDIQKASHKKRLEDGTHHMTKTHICPHCKKHGKSAVMFRYHFDKCKYKQN